MADQHPLSIADKLDKSRSDVLDLSLRNPLLNFRDLKASGVKVIDEIPREVFRIMVRQGKVMYFQAAGAHGEGAAGDDRDGTPEELLSMMAEAESALDQPADRHIDNKLQTSYQPDRIALRLRNTFRRAHLSIEEQGVNILYLALGQLLWYESDSTDLQRAAPLVLVPVELKKSKSGRFNVRWTEEEINGNLSLETKLKADFAIELPPLPDAEDLDVDAYLAGVAEAVARQARWSVDSTAINLGFFSFSKLLIYKDLDSKAWPVDSPPGDHPLVGALYGADGFCEDPPTITEKDHLDELLDVSDMHPVVDSDSSQTLAVVDAKQGRNFVIQGPPGTGKSQTITNLIAEAIADGKTVLFVAEKMAALEVVKRRLDSVHIGDACLELHSHTANKRSVLHELQRTIELGEPQFRDVQEDRNLLRANSDRLNEYARAINAPVGATGFTPNQLIGRAHRIRQSHPRAEWPVLEMKDCARWTSQDFEERRQIIGNLQGLVKTIGMPSQHIYWRSGCSQFMDIGDVRRKLEAALGALRLWKDRVSSLGTLLRPHTTLEDPGRPQVAMLVETARRVIEAPKLKDVRHRSEEWSCRGGQIKRMSRQALEIAQIHDSHDEVLVPQAWESDVSECRQTLSQLGDKWWRGFSGKYRKAQNLLRGMCRGDIPEESDQQVAIVDEILRVQHLRGNISDNEEMLSMLFPGLDLGSSFGGYRRLGETATWLLQLYADTADGKVDADIHSMLERDFDLEALAGIIQSVDDADHGLVEALGALESRLEWRADRSADEVPLADLRFCALENWLTAAHANAEALLGIIRFNHIEKQAADQGLADVVRLSTGWKNAGSRLLDLFELACYEHWITDAMRAHPVLFELDAVTHEETVNQFRRLDQSVFEENRAIVAQQHWNRVPHQHGGGQRGVLQREFQKKRRHFPLRKLMSKAGNAIQQIKPVFMMSPLSIAKFIPPGSVTFDLVIFDEASQVRPVEAIGAILRSRQAVVVGDTKQLPPTSFFDRLDTGDEDDGERSETADLESILGMFCAQGAPERMLRWHYRSRHESLITVSNHEFYDSRLVVFPSPDKGQEEAGLSLQHGPDWLYQRGRGGRVNVREAQVVARAVMAHARSSPEFTLGVAAFSISQARRIEDEVELLRRKDGSCEDFFHAHPHEPFFVKNLETVQGDERDVILISVGYGKVEGGSMSMNFGPLNKDGGERRLNVLITRARCRCIVYANFSASDLDMRRSKARGVEALKTFLHYAETGVLDVPAPTGREVDSPFESAVATALGNRGHDIEHQVGSAGFYIDLAVVDPKRPGRYLLGIECDGASYHSSRSARDRDRLRQQVLEGLDWTIHRIWSTDWYLDPRRELAKVEEAIRGAAQRSCGPKASPGSAPLQRAVAQEDEQVSSDAVPYRTASLTLSLQGHSLHLASDHQMLEWIMQVVEVESPVHIPEVGRRIAQAGNGRFGKRIRDKVDNAVRLGVFKDRLVRRGSFLWLPGQQEVAVRRRDEAPVQLRKVDAIAPEEIGAALLHVVRISFGIEADEALVEASRLFGYKRAGPVIRAHFRSTLDSLLAQGVLRETGGQLFTEE
jgi:very-short-patch-repair endonuclease